MAFLLQVSWGEEEGRDRMLFKKKKSRNFFFPLKGMVKHLILEANSNPSTVAGLGSGLVCGDISVLWTLVWGP